ncbi:MAG: helix-turn-helix domain-containing protein [Cetobacterium sp.]
MDKIYSEILKKIRINNIIQEELAKKLKINQSTLSKNLTSIKNGKCSIQTLNKICDELDLQIDISNKK